MPSSPAYLSLDEVQAIHEMVIAVAGGQSGVRDMGLLESAVYRPQTGYYEDLVEMAAALMESLLINHPFLDGNKRTALIATDTFLRMNGYRLALETDSAHDFIISLLREPAPRFRTVAEWIRNLVEAL